MSMVMLFWELSQTAKLRWTGKKKGGGVKDEEIKGWDYPRYAAENLGKGGGYLW